MLGNGGKETKKKILIFQFYVLCLLCLFDDGKLESTKTNSYGHVVTPQFSGVLLTSYQFAKVSTLSHCAHKS